MPLQAYLSNFGAISLAILKGILANLKEGMEYHLSMLEELRSPDALDAVWGILASH